MISSINVGAHLVDASPLSTLGALCIACAAEHEDKAKLFRESSDLGALHVRRRRHHLLRSSSVSWASRVRGSLTTQQQKGRGVLLPAFFSQTKIPLFPPLIKGERGGFSFALRLVACHPEPVEGVACCLRLDQGLRYFFAPSTYRSFPFVSLMTTTGKSSTSRRWMASGPRSS